MNEDARALKGALENLKKKQCVEFLIDKINMSKITHDCERN